MTNIRKPEARVQSWPRRRRDCVPFVLMPFIGFLAAACGPASEGEDTSPSAESIVSTRPQTDGFFTAIVRLSSPPLLADARTVNGKLRISTEAKKRLEAEQAQFLKDLRALPGKTRVLYTYKLTLNGFALLAPIELKEKFLGAAGVIDVSEQDTYDRPSPVASALSEIAWDLKGDNSVNFIGAGRARTELGLTGRGIRVGVIDSGVDYTHKMFGGAGTEAAYAANDPATVEQGSFPTDKVVGGIDLVGSDFDTMSTVLESRIPKPDADPIDEMFHGTHVAGTIAGRGDGTNTYDGVAPDAQLYAIKIFGKAGGTGNAPILAALEYAADPNGDLDPNDRLDAVNLSLGIGFGSHYGVEREAIKNLARAGSVMVCSAGNDGPVPYIVGSPSTAEHAISVGASIDNSPWNWKEAGAIFSYSQNQSDQQPILGADFALPAEKAVGLSGKLAYLGEASTDLTDAQKAAIRGNIALIDRGTGAANLDEYVKVERAAAGGALGVVMIHKSEYPCWIGTAQGRPSLKIPAIMITKGLGEKLKADLAASKVATMTFKMLEHPERIDMLTDFSSRGPRSLDALIKPELTAPGERILSAAIGSGLLGKKDDGTSMAAPHVAGAVALLRQAHPQATVAEIKARLMGTATAVHGAQGKLASVSSQGAGRIQIVEAATAKVILDPPAISLGVLDASAPIWKGQVVYLTNTSANPLTAKLSWPSKPGLTITGPNSVTLRPYKSERVLLDFAINLSSSTEPVTEVDNVIQVDIAGQERTKQKLVLPVLAVGERGSSIRIASLSRTSNGPLNLSFSNNGPLPGDVVPFNLLAKARRSRDGSTPGPCEVASVGYRVVSTAAPGAQPSDLLEFSIRLASPHATWDLCQPTVLIDTNNDAVPEQELASEKTESWLYDATALRALRASHEDAGNATTVDQIDTWSTVLDTQAFTRYPAIGILATNLSKVAKTPNGLIRVKVGALGLRDDFLGGSDSDGLWYLVDPNNLPYRGLPQALSLANGATGQLATTSFVPKSSLLVFFPQNRPSLGTSLFISETGALRYAP